MTEAHYGGPRALILMSLFGGPKHGYAIIEDVPDVCGVGLGPGTLYGALTSLEPVSYTHLDVYKRQPPGCKGRCGWPAAPARGPRMRP